MPIQPPETPLFDPAAIEKLRKVAGDQGASFVAEMAQLFIEETSRAIGEIQTGAGHADWKQVSRLAHSMKSSAATLGLMRLSAACHALEKDTKGAVSSPQTAALVASVLDQFNQARPVVKDLT